MDAPQATPTVVEIRCHHCSRSGTGPVLGRVEFGRPPGGASERWFVMRLDEYAPRAYARARQERAGRYFDPVWSFPGRRQVVKANGKLNKWTLQPSWPVAIKADGRIVRLKRPLLRCRRCKHAPDASFDSIYRQAVEVAKGQRDFVRI